MIALSEYRIKRLQMPNKEKYRDFLFYLGTVPVPYKELAHDVGVNQNAMKHYLALALGDGFAFIIKGNTIAYTRSGLALARELARLLDEKGGEEGTDMDNPNGTMKPTVRDLRMVERLANDGYAQELAEFMGSKTKKIMCDMLKGEDNE